MSVRGRIERIPGGQKVLRVKPHQRVPRVFHNVQRTLVTFRVPDLRVFPQPFIPLQEGPARAAQQEIRGSSLEYSGRRDERERPSGFPRTPDRVRLRVHETLFPVFSRFDARVGDALGERSRVHGFTNRVR
jgi:hypothetical protein